MDEKFLGVTQLFGSLQPLIKCVNCLTLFYKFTQNQGFYKLTSYKNLNPFMKFLSSLQKYTLQKNVSLFLQHTLVIFPNFSTQFTNISVNLFKYP